MAQTKENITTLNNRKLVLLDLGGVVFQSRGRSNIEINWDIIWDLNYKHDDRNGGLHFQAFLKDYNALTRQDLEASIFLEKVFDTLTFNKELIDFLSVNRDIIIVSDNYLENINYISKRFDFSSWSIDGFYSYDYQLYKSDPKFFKKLLLDLRQYDLTDMIFIDDSQSKLDAAAIHGIRGFLYTSNEQIMKALFNAPS